MAAIHPLPLFPSLAGNFPGARTGGRGGLSSTAELIAVASALHLGHFLRLRCAPRLHLLLAPRLPLHAQEGYDADNLGRVPLGCLARDLLKRYPFNRTVAEALSSTGSSCFSFFGGGRPDEQSVDEFSLQFRTSEGNGSHGRLWTNVILALNVLVYVAQVASRGRLMLWGAKVNALIDNGQLWRLVTSSFLHANIGHLMVNCYSLNSVGPTVEQLIGSRRFIAVYFTSAIAGSLMSYHYNQAPAVGASGAIFGLVGSLAVFVLRRRSLLGGGKEDIQQIARVITLNMAIGLLSRGIDNWGHLGGLLGGVATSWFLGPAWKYKFRLEDGGSVFVDRAPIVNFIRRRRSG